jgi:hypothetical protein
MEIRYKDKNIDTENTSVCLIIPAFVICVAETLVNRTHFRRRSLHDFIAGTAVVRRASELNVLSQQMIFSFVHVRGCTIDYVITNSFSVSGIKL